MGVDGGEVVGVREGGETMRKVAYARENEFLFDSLEGGGGSTGNIRSS